MFIKQKGEYMGVYWDEFVEKLPEIIPLIEARDFEALCTSIAAEYETFVADCQDLAKSHDLAHGQDNQRYIELAEQAYEEGSIWGDMVAIKEKAENVSSFGRSS